MSFLLKHAFIVMVMCVAAAFAYQCAIPNENSAKRVDRPKKDTAELRNVRHQESHRMLTFAAIGWKVTNNLSINVSDRLSRAIILQKTNRIVIKIIEMCGNWELASLYR